VPYGPELFSFYQKATALVLPSLSEGFPQVINEALCAGLPVIASTVGGIPAFLTHLKTAVLVPPADVKALTEAIEMVVKSPELREKLSVSGQELMRNNVLEVQRDRMFRIIENTVLVEAEHSYRSALTDFPGGKAPVTPAVSAIVPVYNEMRHINTVADVLLTQDYPELTEIWFVDGESTDGTFEELQRISQRDPRIRVLTNPRRIQAAGINMVLKLAEGDVIIRIDAHAKYPSDMISKSVEALLKSGAGGVGAIARPLASDTMIGKSIVAVHESKIGVGIASFRQASASGWVDTVWNGCYWKYIVDKVGPFREDMPRTEDNDFNARVRDLGYGLFLSPDIKAFYQPRQTLHALWQQYFANGAGVMQTLFVNRSAIRLRHLIPFTFVMVLLIFLFSSFFWSASFVLLLGVMTLYLAVILIFSIVSWYKKPGWHILLLPVVFFVLHISYGVGAIKGLLQKIFSS
jgi:cellulose synthase/poly-beta-1,6-N-acetylglucosamine synthase-like glycosyltransferase